MKRYTILSSRSFNLLSSFTIHSTIRNPFPAWGEIPWLHNRTFVLFCQRIKLGDRGLYGTH